MVDAALGKPDCLVVLLELLNLIEEDGHLCSAQSLLIADCLLID